MLHSGRSTRLRSVSDDENYIMYHFQELNLPGRIDRYMMALLYNSEITMIIIAQFMGVFALLLLSYKHPEHMARGAEAL